MKRIIAIVLMTCLLLTAFACAKEPENPGDSSADVSATEPDETTEKGTDTTADDTSVGTTDDVTTGAESTSAEETTEAGETTTAKETTSAPETTKPKETTAAPETTEPSETTAPPVIEPEGMKASASKGNLEIGIYHMNPSFTDDNGKDANSRIKEFEFMLSQGYCNTVILSVDFCNYDAIWDAIVKYDVTAWLGVYEFFNSSKVSLETFLNRIDKTLTAAKKTEERWNRFNGFFYDEVILRGETNADYLAMTKAFFEKYEKRNFCCFSTSEFTDYEGNEQQLGLGSKSLTKIMTEALAYTTDAVFDSYSYDVRPGANNGGKMLTIRQTYPEITDGLSYYRVMMKELLKQFDHDVNVWFFPTSYTTWMWGQYRADEAVCQAHLEGLTSLLKEQKNQGGILLYTFMDWRDKNPNELGLRSTLELVDENGNYVLFPDVPKWKSYSAKLKNTVREFTTSSVNQVVFSLN